MNTSDRIEAFAALGDYIRHWPANEKQALFERAAAGNRWFTPETMQMALDGLLKFLDREVLANWLSRYSLPARSKRVGLITAGNIPLVGFHDFMCVLLAGHQAEIKLSSQDNVLLKALTGMLAEISPDMAGRVHFTDKLTAFEAVIATGSDNSARYFRKYFARVPHIIRQNRTSAAVLTGRETPEELAALGTDIFSYYGLGCRNVAKLYVPAGYDMTTLFAALHPWKKVIHHPKYFNNYEYIKAIYMVNRTPHLDTEFALFKEDSGLFSPLAVIYYEEYESQEEVRNHLQNRQEQLQCIVGHPLAGLETVPFGRAQYPEVDDYADKVDTLAFLCRL